MLADTQGEEQKAVSGSDQYVPGDQDAQPTGIFAKIGAWLSKFFSSLFGSSDASKQDYTQSSSQPIYADVEPTAYHPPGRAPGVRPGIRPGVRPPQNNNMRNDHNRDHDHDHRFEHPRRFIYPFGYNDVNPPYGYGYGNQFPYLEQPYQEPPAPPSHQWSLRLPEGPLVPQTHTSDIVPQNNEPTVMASELGPISQNPQNYVAGPGSLTYYTPDGKKILSIDPITHQSAPMLVGKNWLAQDSSLGDLALKLEDKSIPEEKIFGDEVARLTAVSLRNVQQSTSGHFTQLPEATLDKMARVKGDEAERIEKLLKFDHVRDQVLSDAKKGDSGIIASVGGTPDQPSYTDAVTSQMADVIAIAHQRMRAAYAILHDPEAMENIRQSRVNTDVLVAAADDRDPANGPDGLPNHGLAIGAVNPNLKTRG